MLIAHVTTTDPAGAVINAVNGINRHTRHRARLVTTAKNGYLFPGDIDFISDAGEEIESLLIKADVIHLHKLREDDMGIPIKLPKSGIDREIKVSDFIHVNGKEKKVVYHIHGHPYERENVEENASAYKYKLKSGRALLASTPDLAKAYSKFVDVTYFPNCIPENDAKYLPRETDEPLMSVDGERRYAVFHSPTNVVLKDVRLVEEAISNLSKSLPVFYFQVTACPQVQMLTFKRAAHIVFDHMQGYYGLSSLEGLSMGKPTIAGLSDHSIEAMCDFFKIEHTEIPWQTPRSLNALQLCIGDLVVDHGFRRELGERSRKFMESTWSEKNVALRLAALYESL